MMDNGPVVPFRGASSAHVEIPHGNGTLFEVLDAGGSVNKKGFLAPTEQELRDRQQQYLEIYDEARKVFDEVVGTPLFLMYGTLLGCEREGDFIPGDDDFDVGYVSYRTDADAVREETQQLVVKLVLAGFTCSFNRSGRLFRLRRAGDEPGVHLDVRPVWYEGGHVWAHKHAHLPLTLEDFLPVEEGRLRGTPVYVPAQTVRFLEAYYGEGWKVPDPGYSNAGKGIPKFVNRNLNRVCIRPSEYYEMAEEIEAKRADHPNAGRLIATGLHPLYPLDEYNANCEW